MKMDEQIQQVIAAQLDVSILEVLPDAKFVDTLGADSLDIVELIMALEEEFEIEIPDDEAQGIITVKDAINLIVAKRSCHVL